MILLQSSCFDGLIRLNKREEMLSETEPLVNGKRSSKLLVDTGASGLDRNIASNIDWLGAEFGGVEFYALLFSDRQIALTRQVVAENIKFGVYFPGDAPSCNDHVFERGIEFGNQVNLLRKLKLVAGDTFALVDAAGVSDLYHFAEMVAPHIAEMRFWDDGEAIINAEIREVFQELTNSAG